MLSNLILIALLGQTPVPSTTVPPVNERSIIFTHNGATFIVGLQSEKVTVLEPNPPVPPGPNPPGPNPPDVPAIDGVALATWKAFTGSVTSPDRAETAKRLAAAVDSTIGKAGGLGLDAQAIVDDLANTVGQLSLKPKLAGFRLDEVIRSANPNPTREQLLAILGEIKVGLENVK